MYPYARFLWTCLRATRSPPLRLMETSSIPGRVWPQDLDFYGHLNNGRYLSLMDLGRLDLLTRLGFLPFLFRRGWLPLLGFLNIQFRRELRLWKRYQLETRVLGWDEKWIFLQQDFLDGQTLLATSHLQMVIKKGRETIPPQQVAEALGHDETSPPLSPSLRLWLQNQAAMAME